MRKTNDFQHGGDHYSKGISLQHWDICVTFGVGYLEGCATKYLTRWRKKNGVEDLRKAQHYVTKLKEAAADPKYKRHGYVPTLIVEAFCNDNGIKHPDELLILQSLFQWSTYQDLQDIDILIARMISHAPLP